MRLAPFFGNVNWLEQGRVVRKLLACWMELGMPEAIEPEGADRWYLLCLMGCVSDDRVPCASRSFWGDGV
jgi:hypothetical protein